MSFPGHYEFGDFELVNGLGLASCGFDRMTSELDHFERLTLPTTHDADPAAFAISTPGST